MNGASLLPFLGVVAVVLWLRHNKRHERAVHAELEAESRLLAMRAALNSTGDEVADTVFVPEEWTR